MERLVFAAKGFTSFDWASALWAGDHRRRQLYLSRDYRWATRQARIGEFEAAWSQRTRDARAAYKAALVTEETAANTDPLGNDPAAFYTLEAA